MADDKQMNIYEKLRKLQSEYKAPKTEYNSHGGFKYRSIEPMLENLKPLLDKHKVTLMLSDTLETSGETPHIVAHAVLVNLENTKETIEVTASAQEAAIQKGMQAAQISGSTSSYARKYALSGLLLVDDTEELDNKPGDQRDWNAEIEKASTVEKLMRIYNSMDADVKKQYVDKLTVRKQELTNADTN